MTRRATLDLWAMSLALATAKRSTCLRRAVGCVLLDVRGRVLGTGYNGVARGLPHCNELVMSKPAPFSLTTYPHACAGAHAPSGQDLDRCEAVHAEVNACLQCTDPDAIHTCYVTVSPCVPCTKLLMNTGCSRIAYFEPYAHDAAAAALWAKVPGRLWDQIRGDCP